MFNLEALSLSHAISNFPCFPLTTFHGDLSPNTASQTDTLILSAFPNAALTKELPPRYTSFILFVQSIRVSASD